MLKVRRQHSKVRSSNAISPYHAPRDRDMQYIAAKRRKLSSNCCDSEDTVVNIRSKLKQTRKSGKILMAGMEQLSVSSQRTSSVVNISPWEDGRNNMTHFNSLVMVVDEIKEIRSRQETFSGKLSEQGASLKKVEDILRVKDQVVHYRTVTLGLLLHRY